MDPVRLPDDEGLHPGHTHEWWYFFADLANSRTGERLHYTTALMRRDLVWVSYLRWRRAGGDELRRAVHLVPPPPSGASEVSIAPRTNGWTVRVGPRGRSAHLLGTIGELRFRDPGRGACLHTARAEGGIRRYGGVNEMAWYSWPWLEVSGRLAASGDEVTGLGWMEHQWGNTDFRRLSWRYLPVLVPSTGERLIAFRYEHLDHPGSAQMEVAALEDGEARVIAGASLAPNGPQGGLDTLVSLGPRGHIECKSHPDGKIALELPGVPAFFEGPTHGSAHLDGTTSDVLGITELHPIARGGVS